MCYLLSRNTSEFFEMLAINDFKNLFYNVFSIDCNI